DVSVTTRPVEHSDLPSLLTAARVFGDFRAPRLRFWCADSPEAHSNLSPDQRVLAAPLAEVGTREVMPGLTLRLTTDDSHYGPAQAAYDAVDADHPEHSRQARLLSRDDLAETTEAGTMFDVLWCGQWSGYAGTLAHSQLGLDAHVVQEMLLTPYARGMGLGASVSVLLARQLSGHDAADGRVLSGTIHGSNRGALTAARRAGRHDVGGWWWVPLG
uniref:hypothetical protein n=1 Tax=Deinococcus sp. TaxID=47478 RepID=UPI002869E504